MSQRYACRCGKEFASIRSLGGHSRWCAGKTTVGEEENRASAESPTSPISEEMNDCVERTIDDSKPVDEDQIAFVVSFQCGRCSALFSSIDEYQQHYLVDHLGVAGAKTSVGSRSDSPNEADKDRTVGNVRSLCKRCRTRMLSSSEEDDDATDEPLKKRKGTDQGSSANKRDRSVDSASNDIDKTPGPSNGAPTDVGTGDTAVSSTETATSQDKATADSCNSVKNCTGANGSGTGDAGDIGASPGSSLDALPPSAECFEIVKDLLKDANAVSRPLKVLILNFVSGQRVNPYPGKGSVLTIRLGEKVDTVVTEDGSEQAVLRESYVKLNYDTGQWEKIENTKQLHSISASDPLAVA